MPRKRKAPPGYQVVSLECLINGVTSRYWIVLAAEIIGGELVDVKIARDASIISDYDVPFTALSRAKALEYIKIAQLNTENAQLRAENMRLRGAALANAS